MKIKLLFIFLFAFCTFMKAQIPPYVATIYDSSRTEGYYFLVPVRVTTPNAGFHSQLILDRYGDVVYYKSLGTLTNTADFKVQPNGQISYFRNMQFYILDSTFTIVDSVSCKNNITTDSHDFLILPNGHFLMLGNETVVMDLSAYAWFKPAGTHGSATADVKCNVIQELDANKNVVFEWHCADHFAFADVDSAFLSNPLTVDWTHSNALELDDDGNILLSSRHFDEITKINRSDSSIMWRFGGVQNQFTFLNDTTRFYGQHDIRRIDNGHVTLYDNGYRALGYPFHGARAMEYELDEVNKTASVAWSYIYDSSMYSRATGNVQRLPNGNTLINYGMMVGKNLTFLVVDSLGNDIFKLQFPDTMFSYRSFNFQQLPWMFQRPEISCFDSAGITYLDAGAGYSSYNWNNGGTTRMIPVTAADTYYVFVPYGNDGFISSEKIIVTNPLDPCGLGTYINSASNVNGIQIYPNPAGEELYVKSDLFKDEAVSLEIFNTIGEKVLSVKERLDSPAVVDLKNLNAGIYFLRVAGAEKTTVTRIIRN